MGAMALEVMLYLAPSLARVLLNPTRPSLAKILISRFEIERVEQQLREDKTHRQSS